MAPTIGVATDVPPNTYQFAPPVEPYESYTATPVFGSATAAASVTVRWEHPVSFCQVGLLTYAEQPDPVPDQAVSDERAPAEVSLRLVPPTAITPADAAGNSTPYPLSPAATVTATPGMVQFVQFVSPLNSDPP